MDDLKVDAPLVFEGSVKSVGTSNVNSVPADSKTAIVTVDHVRHAPRAMAGLAGKEITVRMAPGEALKEGNQFTFFADSLVFGDNLAVQSRGHEAVVPAEKAAAVMGAAPVVQRLKRRIDEADAVVSGRVVDVRPASTGGLKKIARAAANLPSDRISEHEPFWQEAVIEVTNAHKGPKKRRVVVRFPSSTDVHWHKAPKFKKGQSGIWLLHTPHQFTALAAARPVSDVYTALDPNDYQPPSLAPVVEAMLPESSAAAMRKRSGASKPGPKTAIAKKKLTKAAVSRKVTPRKQKKKRR